MVDVLSTRVSIILIYKRNTRQEERLVAKSTSVNYLPIRSICRTELLGAFKAATNSDLSVVVITLHPTHSPLVCVSSHPEWHIYCSYKRQPSTTTSNRAIRSPKSIRHQGVRVQSNFLRIPHTTRLSIEDVYKSRSLAVSCTVKSSVSMRRHSTNKRPIVGRSRSQNK